MMFISWCHQDGSIAFLSCKVEVTIGDYVSAAFTKIYVMLV